MIIYVVFHLALHQYASFFWDFPYYPEFQCNHQLFHNFLAASFWIKKQMRDCLSAIDLILSSAWNLNYSGHLISHEWASLLSCSKLIGIRCYQYIQFFSLCLWSEKLMLIFYCLISSGLIFMEVFLRCFDIFSPFLHLYYLLSFLALMKEVSFFLFVGF